MTDNALAIHIARATLDDADALFSLVERFATSFRPEKEAFTASLRQLLPDEAAWLAVARVGNTVAGYLLGFDHCAFYANGRVAWVEEIMVDERRRRMGVGRKLMQAFEAWATTRGAKLVGLATRRAASFYQALGYEESATFYRKLL